MLRADRIKAIPSRTISSLSLTLLVNTERIASFFTFFGILSCSRGVSVRIQSRRLSTAENGWNCRAACSFCLQGFLPPPLTSVRVFADWVPCRRFAGWFYRFIYRVFVDFNVKNLRVQVELFDFFALYIHNINCRACLTPSGSD